MIKWSKSFHPAALILLTGVYFYSVTEHLAASQKNDVFTMNSVIVDSKYAASFPKASDTVNLGSFPENVDFYFDTITNPNETPIRIRYRLEGYDSSWQDNNGEMHLAVRFYNDTGDQISQKTFPVSGESAGWTGSLKTSQLTHRRETLVVPPQASKVMVVVSSAGPPDTVGIYAVADLVLSKSSNNSSPVAIIQSPFNHQSHDETASQISGWVRDGTSPSMAKIVNLGQEPVIEAFAIMDDSSISHAEWHNNIQLAPKVNPGDQILLEWNEMFSIGMGDTKVAIYKNLPPGRFLFHVEAVDIMDNPTGAETSLAILVPPAFWKTFWFWGIVFTIFVITIMAAGRYIIMRKMRWEMLHLERQHLLEQERVRIAHDIHDDLGARVTQISLVSAMAQANAKDLEQTRADFAQISQMSRDLVTALYETVWAVNPENDNLDELGNYLFQMVNKLCERTPCRCRFHIQNLPREIVVPSKTRHNICMAVKEAIHNVIKHALASEVTLTMTFQDPVLSISIQDNGCGFQPAGKFTGNGLNNLKQRLKDIGGACQIESSSGQGTVVKMQLKIIPTGPTQRKFIR
jgi:signal transduction histidine kinase